MKEEPGGRGGVVATGLPRPVCGVRGREARGRKHRADNLLAERMGLFTGRGGWGDADFLLPLRWTCMNDRDEDHAKNDAEEERVEISDETAHMSSYSGRVGPQR
jgi:hypothetical protein